MDGTTARLIALTEPDGMATREACETQKDHLLRDLKVTLPVDMITLPLHILSRSIYPFQASFK